jgi:hypothetical protein
MARWPHEREATGLGGGDGAPRAEERGLPRRRAGDRVAVQPRLDLEAREEIEVRGTVDAADLLPGCGPALAGAAQRVEQVGEALLALGVPVPARRMEAAERRVGDQLDALSRTRPASRASPSSSAATATASQSGPSSGRGGSGAVASNVAMCR